MRNCIENARTNGRAVRTALTAEMWDAINGAWLELKRFEGQRPSFDGNRREEITNFIDFVKQTSLAFDGAVYRTMLRDPSYWFSRLGRSIERADNTARILDVKYHVLLPDSEAVGGSLDYFQWTAILRAVSAINSYHWVYREGIKPWLVADLLILRTEMPLSLLASYDNINRSLDSLGKAYGRQGMAQRHARRIQAQLENSSIQEIFPARPARVHHRVSWTTTTRSARPSPSSFCAEFPLLPTRFARARGGGAGTRECAPLLQKVRMASDMDGRLSRRGQTDRRRPIGRGAGDAGLPRLYPPAFTGRAHSYGRDRSCGFAFVTRSTRLSMRPRATSRGSCVSHRARTKASTSLPGASMSTPIAC